MNTLRKLLVFPLAVLTTTAGSAFASPRPHIVNPGQLMATVEAQGASQDADRAAVREALGHPEVRSMAAHMGVDVNRLATAVDTMSGADLERAASAARQVNHQLVGGASTVVISTTTIIIILLVVLLIVVIAK